MDSIWLAVDRIRFSPDPNAGWEVRCPGCQSPLRLHQPDEQWPERLLGTCSQCHAWFLIDAAAEVMVRLPHEDDLRGPESSPVR
jgi:hypothetical protein